MCTAPVVIVGWELGVEGGGVLASITLSQYWPKRTYKHTITIVYQPRLVFDNLISELRLNSNSKN